jgi:hypothetical protein
MTTAREIEKTVLHLLCAGAAEGPVKDALVPLLCDYPWQNPLHQAIFNALDAVPGDSPATLRQLLPAKLTRMGFPDVEWEEFFAPPSLSRRESMALVKQMLAVANPVSNSDGPNHRDVE